MEAEAGPGAPAVDASLYKKQHTGQLMDKKFYKDDFFPTSIEEVEYVRSPFYDLAKSASMGGEDDVHEVLDEIGMKFSAMDPIAASVLIPAKETPESVAFTRYADEVTADKSEKHIF